MSKFNLFLADLLNPRGTDDGEKLLHLMVGAGDDRLRFEFSELVSEVALAQNCQRASLDGGDVMLGQPAPPRLGGDVLVCPCGHARNEPIEHFCRRSWLLDHPKYFQFLVKMVGPYVAHMQAATTELPA